MSIFDLEDGDFIFGSGDTGFDFRWSYDEQNV